MIEKTTITYTCDQCGYSSTNKKAVAQCEASHHSHLTIVHAKFSSCLPWPHTLSVSNVAEERLYRLVED